MSPLPTLYTARSDADPAHLARVEDWYARRHAPDLIQAGFYTAQVYYSEIGTPRICNLYEIPGPALFLTQAYRDVAAKDVEGPEVIGLLTNRSNTIYEQVLTVNVPDADADWASGDRTGAVTAAAISTVRFDVPDAAAPALLDWYRDHEFPRLRGRPGFRAGRLCREGPPHPVAPSRDPRWFTVLEWDTTAAALADGAARDATARLEFALPGRVSRVLYNVGRRHFRLARPATP